jgi:hypothetical protein
MDTSIIDKRKQFQITVLTNKLNQYNTLLKELIESKDQLCNDQSQLDLLKYNYNRHILNTEKDKLEAILEDYKNEYTTLRTSQSVTLNNFKLLPETLKSNLAAEKLVYEEEYDNINAIIEETKNILSIEMQKQEIDKLALEDAIIDYKNQITIATDNITQIQTSAHSFRKNTIAQLHTHKQLKKETLNKINSLQQSSSLFDSHINQLTIENNKLLEIKKTLINNHYQQEDNQFIILTDLTELSQYITVNIEVTVNETDDITTNKYRINNLVTLIDSKIQDNIIRINSLKNKASRDNIRNNNLIQILLGDLHLKNREKIISYKDSYKMAKQEKTILEDALEILQNKFNNWETEVIGAIQNRYKESMEQLKSDGLRAQERLDIMITRFNDSHQTECQQLEIAIKNYDNKLAEINIKIMKINLEIKNIVKQLDELNITQTKLEKIDARIKETQKAINIIETDLATLQSML